MHDYLTYCDSGIGCSLAECCWLRVPYKAPAEVSEDLTGEGPPSKLTNMTISRTCGLLNEGPEVLAGCCPRHPQLRMHYISLCTGWLAARQQSSPEGALKCAGRGKRVSKKGTGCLLQPSLRRDLHRCGWVFSFQSRSLHLALGCAHTQIRWAETRIKDGGNQLALHAQRREARWVAQKRVWSQSTLPARDGLPPGQMSVWCHWGCSHSLFWPDRIRWQS